MLQRTLFIALLTIAFSLSAFDPAFADRRERAEDLVRDAARTTKDFTDDANYRALWDYAADAKAIVIIPKSFRAGFLVGGSGGNGVVVARRENGTWSYPNFMRISSLSVGFQAGGEVSEIVLAVMTDRGVDQLLSSSVKLGADLSIAAGPVGGGAKAQTADVLAFSRSKGVYGSVSVEGVALKVNNKWNRAFYGGDPAPRDIILFNRASNPKAEPLRSAVSALASKDAAE